MKIRSVQNQSFSQDFQSDEWIHIYKQYSLIAIFREDFCGDGVNIRFSSNWYDKYSNIDQNVAPFELKSFVVRDKDTQEKKYQKRILEKIQVTCQEFQIQDFLKKKSSSSQYINTDKYFQNLKHTSQYCRRSNKKRMREWRDQFINESLKTVMENCWPQLQLETCQPREEKIQKQKILQQYKLFFVEDIPYYQVQYIKQTIKQNIQQYWIEYKCILLYWGIPEQSGQKDKDKELQCCHGKKGQKNIEEQNIENQYKNLIKEH